MKSKIEDLTAETVKGISEFIETMDLEKSNKLPREEILAKQLGVSRITIRNALSQLASEGVIFRKHGKGTFVNTEAIRIQVNFSPIEDFREVITNSGYQVDVEIVQITVRGATKTEASKLAINEGTEIILVEKMFFADRHPAIYCIDRMPLNLYKGEINKANMSLPLGKLAEEHLKRKITWDKVELLAVTNKELPIPENYFNSGQPKALLHCNVVNFDEKDEPIIFSNEYIDTEFIRFNMIRKKSGY